MAFESIVAGLLAGITYGAAGYFKSAGESPDPKKFGYTLILGAISGVLATGLNMEVAPVYEYASSMAILHVLESGLKGAYRRYLLPAMKRR